MTRKLLAASAALLMAACSPPQVEESAPESPELVAPAEFRVDMLRVNDQGTGESMGTVLIRGGEQGAVFEVNLQGATPGEHGFHLHQTAHCGPSHDTGPATPGGAAGSHWDPATTNQHAGPEGAGHLGDLPRLEANAEGQIAQTVTAPRITDIAQLSGRALMLHEGGDNYTDTPENGGGGARVACGVIG